MTFLHQIRTSDAACIAVVLVGLAAAATPRAQAGTLSQSAFGGRLYMNKSVQSSQQDLTGQDNADEGDNTADITNQTGGTSTGNNLADRRSAFAQQQQGAGARNFGLGWQFQERLNSQVGGTVNPVVPRVNPTLSSGISLSRSLNGTSTNSLPRYLTQRPGNVVTSPGNTGGATGNQNSGSGSLTQLSSAERFEIQWMRRMIDRQSFTAAMGTLAATRSDGELAQTYTDWAMLQSQQVDQLQTWLQQWYGINYEPQLRTSDERQLERYGALEDATFQRTFDRWLRAQEIATSREETQIARRAVHEDLGTFGDASQSE